MQYTGRATVNRRAPRALGVCDRCQTWYQHDRLQWQFEWRGPRIQNTRFLVCDSCYDKPFELNRTIILPPDPVPITNPRPENFISDDNPISELNWSPLSAVQSNARSGNIGNMGTVDRAFTGLKSKRGVLSAYRRPSLVGASNYVGKSWSSDNVTPPNQLTGEVPTYGVTSFSLYAPSDMPFLATGAVAIAFQGWDGSAWQAIWSGNSAGTNGEVLTQTGLSATAYYGHRFLLTGNGASAVAISFIELNTSAEGVLAAAPAADAS